MIESLLIEDTAMTVEFNCLEISKLEPNCSNVSVPFKVVIGISLGYLNMYTRPIACLSPLLNSQFGL